jgi:hypothetical protein
MITEWRKAASIITADRAIGDQLYLVLRAFQDDPIPEESIFTVELSGGALATIVLAKKVFTDAIDEFNSGGYPQALLDAGKSEAEIDALRSIVKASHYDLYPDGVNRVTQDGALDDFILAQGYTKAQAEQ